ncbi:MAG: beta strand repeat-containing protein, partial [Capsulimonadaceae bacterium]
MKTLNHLVLLCLLSVLLAVTPACAQSTYTVTSLADDGGVGELRAAINDANANPGSTIAFQGGLWGTITLTSALPNITASVTIQGPGASVIAVDGAGKYRPFNISTSGAVTIFGLTVQHGSDQADSAGGGGILQSSGVLTLTDCTVTGNAATGDGGGISLNGTGATLTGCTVTQNTSNSTAGGGIVVNIPGADTFAMTNCTLSGNTVSDGPGACGGGARIVSGSATVTNCTMSSNLASGFGGGFDNEDGTVTITACTFSDNSSSIGGGLSNGNSLTVTGSTFTGNSASIGGGINNGGGGGSITVTNCAFAGNSSFSNSTYTGNPALDGGGAINNGNSRSGNGWYGGVLTVVNCTLTSNGTTVSGGGVYTDNGATSTVTNSVLYGDSAPTGSELAGPGSTAATYSDVQGSYTGTGNINASPLFVNFPADLHPAPASPCYEMGTSAGAPEYTLDNVPRPTPPTMGAYEPQPWSNLTAESGSTQVTLAWMAGQQATGYNIYRGTASGGEGSTPIATGVTAPYTDTGLTNGVAYYYDVAAVDAAGTLGLSNEAGATPEPVYNAAFDFASGYTTETNPNGAWSYDASDTATGPFSLLTGYAPAPNTGGAAEELYDAANSATLGPAFAYSLQAINNGNIDVAANTLYGCGGAPGLNQYADLIFTAPASGNYALNAVFTGVEYGDSAELQIATEGTTLFSAPISAFGAEAGYNYTVALTASQQVIVTFGEVGGTISDWPALIGINVIASLLPPPPAPTSLTAAAGLGQVSLQWAATPEATSYNVYRGTARGVESTTAVATGITTTAYTDSGLTNGVTYFYKVAAANEGGTSAQSSEASATPVSPMTYLAGSGFSPTNNPNGVWSYGDTPTLGGPFSLYVSTASEVDSWWTWSPYNYDLLTYTWTGPISDLTSLGDALGEVDYNPQTYAITSGSDTFPPGAMQLHDGNSGQLAVVRFTAPNTGVYNVSGSFTPGDSNANNTVFILHNSTAVFSSTRVGSATTPFSMAIYANLNDTIDFAVGGQWDYGDTDVGATIVDEGGPVTSAPTSLTATPASQQVALSWTASPAATSYNVYRGTATEGESATAVATGITSTSYTNTGLTNGVTYFYTVAALDSGGTSAQSNEASATPWPAPVAPTNLSVTSSTGRLILSWSPSATATSYNVYMGTASGGEGAIPVASTTSTTAIIPDLTNLDTYYFQVAGVNADGVSSMSSEASNEPILETVLHNFNDGSVSNDGYNPHSLIEASNGSFYGTTTDGGAAGEGTIFQITPSGNETILHSFGDGSVTNDGANPNVGLVLGSDGNLYGSTFNGGSSGSGVVFCITSAGVVTILHNFGDGSVTDDGLHPDCRLIQASDGNYFGVTAQGGTANSGTVYQITPAGVLNILHNFGDGTVANDGTNPQGIIQGTDGNIYGTTWNGGLAGDGVVFRMTSVGAVDILHSFQDRTVANDGANPDSGVMQASDGNFYGTTYYGGSIGDGVVYQITPAGATTILHSFQDGSVAYDGSYPVEVLVQGTDGNLYGTTWAGGYANEGTAFRMGLSGNETVLHGFGDGSVRNDGANIWPQLIQGSDGTLYGTSYNGGSAGAGTFFRIDAIVTPAVPAPPTDLTAIAGNAQVSLTWNPGVGQEPTTGYNVYRGTAAGAESATAIATGVTTTTFTNTGLTNGIKYYYKVAALNTVGTSGQSNEASATPSSALPASPAGLTATSGNTQIALVWTGASGATSYNIYSGTAAAGESSTPIATGVTTTTYLNTGLTNGTAYYYVVAAVNSSGTSGKSNEASAVPWTGAPNSPSGLAATEGNAQVGLTWLAASGATTYSVYMGTSSGGENPTPMATGITGASYTNTGLTNGTTYFYKVAAVNAGGTSGYSNEASATPLAGPPAAPLSLSATSSTGRLILNWSPVGTATSYEVYMGTSASGEGAIPVAFTAGTTAIIPNLTDLDTYYFKVAAVNADGVGSMSTEASNEPILETVLHNFNDGSVVHDGNYPLELIQASNGYFYGTAYQGGSSNEGMVFQIDTSGNVTVLHSFGDGSVPDDGTSPYAGLVLGSNGIFYGTTNSGGSAGLGTVFSITSAGVVTILHSFGDGSVSDDGANPEAALIQASDGNFYGTTYDGGSANGGAVYRITPSGVVTILHNFNDGTVSNDGTNSRAALVQGGDGNFYGTTDSGGSAGGGTVFRITPASVVTILHNFGDGTVPNDGTYPQGGLIQASDGNLYGTSNNGGSAGYGAAWRISLSGVMTVLHDFSDGSVPFDVHYPGGGLIQATDGNLYGVSWQGGYGNNGTAFRMSLTGNVSILHGFSDGSVPGDGTNLATRLVQASDGTLYGTSSYGGVAGGGTFFRIDAAVTPAVPAPPTDLTATAGNAQVSLSWTTSTGASSYSIYRGTASGGEGSTAVGFVTQTTFTDSGLTNGTKYFYKVAAVIGDGTSAQSTEASATPEPTIPSAPASLAATAGNTQVALSWTGSTGATTYNVYRGTATDGESTTAIATGITGVSYTNTGLTNGTSYFYKVAAVNGGGTSSQSTEASATPEPPIPAAPTGLTATAGNAQVALSWTASTGATTYNVYRGTATGAESTTAIATAVTGAAFTNTGLTNGTAYFYKVAAVNGGGTSAQSTEASATPEPGIPAAPTGLAATAGNAQVAL